MANIKIFTAFHKEFELPENKDIFIPVHVGKAISNINLDMIGDDSGDNISAKNQNYCELTMLYWVWKNYDLSNIDYIGLAHYRRLFNIDEKIIKDINKYDIILPKKEKIGGSLFFSLSIEQQYKLAHISEDFEIMKNVLLRLFPEYKKDIDKVFCKRNKLYILNKAYFYNMFIMKKTIFFEYCDWLFNILFNCEKEIKLSGYPYQDRVFGFLGERLLNLFVEKKRKEGYKILEIDLIKS